MGFFQKLSRGIRSVGSVFKKGAAEVGGAFKKSGAVIGKGLGSLAGSAAGAALFEGAALAVAPELAVPAALAGRVVGGAIGGELGSRTGTVLTTDKKPVAVATLGKQIHNIQMEHERAGVGKIGMRRGHASIAIPDSKYFRQNESTGGGRRLGQDGHGIFKPRVDNTNLIEKAKKAKEQRFSE